VPWPAATPAEEDRRQELVSGSPIAQIACCLPRPLKVRAATEETAR